MKVSSAIMWPGQAYLTFDPPLFTESDSRLPVDRFYLDPFRLGDLTQAKVALLVHEAQERADAGKDPRP